MCLGAWQAEVDCAGDSERPRLLTLLSGIPERYRDGTIDGESILYLNVPAASVECMLDAAAGCYGGGMVTVVWDNEKIRFTPKRLAKVLRGV